jgi:hypothetical protein
VKTPAAERDSCSPDNLLLKQSVSDRQKLPIHVSVGQVRILMALVALEYSMSVLIALTGIPGSGVTTLAEQVCQLWQSEVPLLENALPMTPDCSLIELRQWLNRGGHPTEYSLSWLKRSIDERHRLHQCAENQRSPGSQIILLDTQFGRSHSTLDDEIAVQCWIDIPRDIAIARKLRQWSRELQNPQIRMSTSERLGWITEFCDGYLHVVRDLMDWQEQHVRPRSEIIVNGDTSPQQVLDSLLRQLRGFIGRRRLAG